MKNGVAEGVTSDPHDTTKEPPVVCAYHKNLCVGVYSCVDEKSWVNKYSCVEEKFSCSRKFMCRQIFYVYTKIHL